MGLGNRVKFPKNIAETTLEPGRTGWASDRKKGEIQTGKYKCSNWEINVNCFAKPTASGLSRKKKSHQQSVSSSEEILK